MKSISSELSWLYFNQCIIDEAADETNPLYERIKFLAIFSSNLDEFFRVKVNRLANSKKKKDSQLLNTLLAEIQLQQIQFGVIWKEQIVKELAQNNVIFYNDHPIENFHLKEIERFFKTHILGSIQVVFLNKNIENSYFLNNRGLYFFIELINLDNECVYAYINIPSDKVNRYKILSKNNEIMYIISLDEMVKNCLHLIFSQHKVNSCYAIKINRDEDYEIEDELSGNLISKIKHKIKERSAGLPTRFLYDENMPKPQIKLCKSIFNLKKKEMIAGGKMHNLFDLFKFPNPLAPHLQNEPYPALNYEVFENTSDVFSIIEQKNHLIHFPYHSYHYVLQFFNHAAIDAYVTEIKVTLYRISTHSLIVNALISAAKNGKKVTVFVEVKARFDENNNLHWANEMKKAGIKIMYSLPNVKVHAKIALITRKIESEIKQYAYLSTGNFNESTASIYADYGFFTSEINYTSELKNVFKFLKNNKYNPSFETLLVAGFNLKKQLLHLIDAEINNHKNGKSSGIFFKINGLDEKEIIKKLEQAGAQGVEITLIVRGICTLLPNENIKIYRIIDMFLEHARIYKFNNAGKEMLYLSSADLMNRNLNHRIEVGFPILDVDLKSEINQIIQYQLEDNTKKRTILDNGKNELVRAINQPKRAQTSIYNWLKTKK